MNGTVLICGATGLLGKPLRQYFDKAGFRTIGVGFSKESDHQVDLRDQKQANRLLEKTSPDFVINLVASTNVDLCEQDPDQAYLLNTHVVENLASWAAGRKTHLVHISTDQVYDGLDRTASSESDVILGNYYAYSKYLGEIAATNCGGTVLRTNFFGKSHVFGRESFTDWLFKAFNSGEKITLLTDILFSPLSIHTLCESIVRITPARKSGVFNLGSTTGMTKAEFGLSFARLLGFGTSQVTLATSLGVVRSFRPKNMIMNTDLFSHTFEISLPTLADELLSVRNDYVL